LQELSRSYEQAQEDIKYLREKKEEVGGHSHAAQVSIHRTLQDISRHQAEIIDTQKLITLTLNKIKK